MTMYDPRLQKTNKQKLLPESRRNEWIQFLQVGGLLLVIAGLIVGFLAI